ncbi:uncharacterized protein LOC132284095 isoform X2 [Cornus florida]|uniref:uncharacterized protein LOC132284095 isoform X2 n=1 Tax=Cornus florida TaxID=4283 RepID=UPI0028A29376|nr:uncharacterized protein LOC132284095 isoform X2 [Cornus florida]
MAKKVIVTSRTELLERWRVIEEEDDDDDNFSSDPSNPRRLRRLKEEWFSDAFNFLIFLPKQNHIWCGAWDLMGPLLETFYNYFKDERHDSPLKLLWKRISEEMQLCTQCICQHHQAQGIYNVEYDLKSVGPLLDVLQSLDEERITEHLKEINARIARGEYDPVRDNTEVVSVIFEVLMFPILLDDQSLVTEFQTFIEAIDNSHELTLAGHQQYPGVYALLFMKSRRSRSIGFRLAVNMGKLRGSTDLESLQPLLKKCIGFLEAGVLPSSFETSRPRVQLDRITIWLGIKALLGFLEPPAFEEGILERYPIFLSIVLNHISDDSVEFSYAVNCLRLLFEMLGCKLWLRATLSPSVMRNTLLGQCFHTRNEKSHKEIFDLFLPFLQSLEALQDGEHEKQRRHFLYFLLHQVTVSSNFSILMRQKACQIALVIIHRGYKMNPPCPPFECAHMWGPSLVSSLKDSSLHSSLRQPAFDVIQTIIISDSAALISSMLNCCAPPSIGENMSTEFNDEDDDDNLPSARNVGEKGVSCWNEFSVQSQITSLDIGGWMCIPMLWCDVLVDIDPSFLPVSFSKAVFFALSRFSMVEPENSTEMTLPVRNWLSTCASEISHLFGWKVPSGSDDGAEGKESKNSIKVSTMCMPLIRTFKRITANFLVKMEQGVVRKMWTWEPRMSESLILLLVDPNDNVRHVGRRILEQVSNTRGLACGLQFLCSCSSSLSAILLGLRHALKLVQLDSVLLNFQSLHHFFFVVCKLLKEGVTPTPTLPRSSSEDLKISKYSSQGGFLGHPVFDPVTISVDGDLSDVDSVFWEKFCCLLSEIAWPSIRKCMAEGKAFIDYKISQMTCVRLLEILPVVFEKLLPLVHKTKLDSKMMVENLVDFKWFHDLMDWGRSSLAVIVRYWKLTVVSLLALLKGWCSDNSASAISAIEKLLSCDSVAMDEVTEQVSRLSVSLSNESSCVVRKTNLKSKPLVSENLSFEKKCSAQGAQPFSLEDEDVQILDSVTSVNRRDGDNVVVLSDDETQMETSAREDISIHLGSSPHILDKKTVTSNASDKVTQGDIAKKNSSAINASKNLFDAFPKTDASDCAGFFSQKLDSDSVEGRLGPAPCLKSKSVDFKTEDTKSNRQSQRESNLKTSFEKIISSENRDQPCVKKVSGKSDTVIKELVRDEVNSWDFAVKSAKFRQSYTTKPSTSGPKRQVIQLNVPVENRSAYLHRLEVGVKRFKPPRLDDWYRPILEIDYFATVGLASASEEGSKTLSKLKEVPVCFHSPEEYVDIFRPLVLEEFKAQLHSSFLEMNSSEEMYCCILSVVSVERIDDFHLVRCVHDDGDSAGSGSCSENDLVLLTRQPLKNSSHDVHILGKVERREKDNKRRSSILVIRFYLQNGSSRLNRTRKLLIERSKWYVSRVMNITPQLREFQALSAIKDIPLLPNILNPINHSAGQYESRKDLSKLSQSLQRILKSSYNESQVQAISAAIGPLDSKKDFELSLIQGPPGTGKTRTILAIVSGLLALSRTNDTKRSPDGGLKPSNTSCSTSKLQISQSAAIARAWQDAALARQLNEESERTCKFTGSCTRGRVLICAQSNAAVDELVSRISTEGLYGSDGLVYKPYLVRVGNPKTVHPNSLPFFIDTLVDHRLAERMNAPDAKNDMYGDLTALRSNLEKLVDRIRFFEAKRANLQDRNSNSKGLLEGDALKGDDGKEMCDSEIAAKLRKLYEKKKAIYIDLAAAQAHEKKAYEESKALKHKLRKSILREAEIVVTTLSGCGGDLYGVCSESISSHKFRSSSENTLFDAVVIDEAAQALEPATLIPLQLLKSKGTKCIMVGDPKQLPATVISNVASKYLYQCSMFERLQRAGHPVVMLTEQYRMHPEICQFPSLHFYDSKLLNGDQMSSKSAPFHESKVLGPYVFFDIIDGQELHGRNSGALSLYNECEADAAVAILRFLKKSYPSEFIGGRIGIITPYKCQLSLLRSRFSSAFGSSVTAEIEFNTVDGFQGREVDILVLSTVRAATPCSTTPRIGSSSIGFVADARRMNVALTRAKLSMWILGNTRTLQTNHNWAALVRDAKERNLVISVKKPYESMFKSVLLKHRISENSDNRPRQLKHGEKVKEATRHAELKQNNASDTFVRKRKYMNTEPQSEDITARDEHDDSVPSEGFKTNKRRAREEREFSVKKNLPSQSVVDIDNRTSKDVKSSIKGKPVTDDKRRGKGSVEKQSDTSNANVGKGDHKPENSTSNLDNSKPVIGDSNKLLNSVALNRPTKLFEHDKQMNMEVAIPSHEGSHNEQDGIDNTSKEAITKRKQQRDAVDALLSSALISSKKSEPSPRSLPLKRPLSPKSTAGRGIKPPKPKKASSSRTMQDQRSDSPHHRKREKSSSSPRNLDEV